MLKKVFLMVCTVAFFAGCQGKEELPAAMNPIAPAVSSNANLSAVNLVPGALTPSFMPEFTIYTVQVEAETSAVKIRPVAQNAKAAISLNGFSIASGEEAEISLLTQQTELRLEVTAEDKITTKTYQISVIRKLPVVYSAQLSSLLLSAGTLEPVFSSAVTAYSVRVPNSTESILITPAVKDETAAVRFNGNAVQSGKAVTVALSSAVTDAVFSVTARDGAVRNYTVKIIKEDRPTLAGLEVSSGSLSPAFQPSVFAYTVTVPKDRTLLGIKPSVLNLNALIKLNGQAVNSGVITEVSLSGNCTEHKIEVSLGGETLAYTLTVLKISSPDLAMLSIDKGTLLPGFSAAVTEYSAAVDSSVNSVAVTASAIDADAVIKINGSTAVSGQPFGVALVTGLNNIAVSVIAADGAVKTYNLSIQKQAEISPYLSALTVSGLVMSPQFSTIVTEYTVSLPANAAEAQITAVLENAAAELKINGEAAASGSAKTVAITANLQDVAVTVTTDLTVRTYLLHFVRAVAKSVDLSALVITDCALNPAFDPAKTLYYCTATMQLASVRVSPLAVSSNASVKVNGQLVSAGVPVEVALQGTNTLINVEVSVSGASKTYQVEVGRLADTALSALAVDKGTLNPAFNAAQLSYAVSVSNVSSINISATLKDANALMTVNGQSAASGVPFAVALSGSTTDIEVKVSSSLIVQGNTFTAQTVYAVKVNVEAPLYQFSNLANIGDTSEGIAFDGAGNVFVTSYKNNKVIKITAAGAKEDFGSGFSGPSAMGFYNTNLYVAEYAGKKVSLLKSDKTKSTYASKVKNSYGMQEAFKGANGMAINKAGVLYVSDFSAFGGGRIVRIPDGTDANNTILYTFSTGKLPNGMALISQGTKDILYVLVNSTSYKGEVWKIEVNTADNSVSAAVLDFTKDKLQVADGIAIDAAGALWISHSSYDLSSNLTKSYLTKVDPAAASIVNVYEGTAEIKGAANIAFGYGAGFESKAIYFTQMGNLGSGTNDPITYNIRKITAGVEGMILPVWQ